ncbi:hypothetical protein [Micromonospora sp. WMMD1155]|uniref:hypothetical protein n=1 Tax=Micromonospora sp. WMMD1155 TaxID=3016094 RepID=UPI00249A95DF|nr:hypothetical protein [Micromonospora sp. WMMD1155]WFE52759.1 hypothetical protein O7617_21665 [Micromonospora sp. WMMD1155]
MDTSATPTPDTTPRRNTDHDADAGDARRAATRDTDAGNARQATTTRDTDPGDARRATTRNTDAGDARRATTRNTDAKRTRRSATSRSADLARPPFDAEVRPTTSRAAPARQADRGRAAPARQADRGRAAPARSADRGRAAARRTATGRGTGPTGAAPGDDTTASGVDPAVASGRASAGRRRRTLLLLLALTAVTSAAALVLGLLSWAPDPPDPPDPPEPARPLTVAEGERLAAVRVTNLRDLRAGVRVTAGVDAARVELVGWVDWSRSLLYLDVGGPGAGAERGLVQRVGPVLVVRPDPAAVPTPAAPPLVPPADRWRLHRLAPGTNLAPVLDLLLRLAADRPDATQAVPGGGARWVARETVAAGPVDVLQASLPGTPAPDPAPGSTAGSANADTGADADGQTRYWLDQDARLHKLVTRLPGVGPVTVVLNRADRPTLHPVDALGGRPGLPRALTDAERRRLERLPARLTAQGGATVTLTAPVGTDTNLRGAGWVSWTRRTAYLVVADLGVPERRTLLRRDTTGLARVDLPAGAAGGGTAEAPERPPLPPPAGPWRVTRPGGDALSVLVDAAVAAGSVGARGTAVRVREDVADRRTVDVIEVGPPDGRLRYWIDRDGSLRRLELHTDADAWAQLDLRPAVVPRLAAASRPR